MMLLGINPLLTGALLGHLDRMGHGDCLLIGDANFPATRLVEHVVELPAVDAPTVLSVVRVVLPLSEDHPAVLMDPGDESAPVVDALIESSGLLGSDIALVTRTEFYRRATLCSVAVRTGEKRLFGNIIVAKGVVA